MFRVSISFLFTGFYFVFKTASGSPVSLVPFPAAAAGAKGRSEGRAGRRKCNIFFNKEDAYEHILHSRFLGHKDNKFL